MNAELSYYRYYNVVKRKRRSTFRTVYEVIHAKLSYDEASKIAKESEDDKVFVQRWKRS